MGAVDTIEWACVLCDHHIQNDWASKAMNLHQFCIKLEHSSLETIQMIQEATAMGLLMHHVFCRGSVETSNHTGDSVPLQPRYGTLWLLDFPKTKITFEREEKSDCRWDSGKYDRAADVNWENCERSQGAYSKGDRGVIVLHTMSLLSSINVWIFHSTWLDTFWAVFIHLISFSLIT